MYYGEILLGSDMTRAAALAFCLVLTVGAPAWAQAPLAAQGCLGCHGAGGAGSTPIAGLAGRPAGDLVAAMAAFRAGQRPATIMTRIAKGYSEAEIAAMAAYFAALPAGGAR
jgi:sulfide dehydrogenase cytochrome subunit